MKLKSTYGLGPALIVVACMCLLVTTAGCISQLGALIYLIKGGNVDPEFTGLKKKRVAVVVRSDESAFGPSELGLTVSKFVTSRLIMAPDDITVVSPTKVEQFLDLNGWDESEVQQLGEFCDAEMVLVIKISDYSIHEGATLYKGRSEFEILAYDITKGGSLAFAKGPEQYNYPENGRPSLQTSERDFEAFYLASLTNHIARFLVTHDKTEAFANEAAMD